MAFLAQKLNRTINIWFTLCLAPFFRKDHLLNVIILGVYAKRWLKCTRISRQKLMQHKIWSIIVFLTLAVRRLSIGRILSEKNMGGTGLVSEKKRKLYMQNLTKKRKQPPVVILQKSIFYDIFVWCLWLRIIRRSDQSA